MGIVPYDPKPPCMWHLTQDSEEPSGVVVVRRCFSSVIVVT